MNYQEIKNYIHSNGKLNFKLPNKELMASYHTNDDLITVGIYLDDFEKNGPLKIIKNSHKKKLYIQRKLFKK